MLQRIQTLYLLVALALLVACMCLPLGIFVGGGLPIAKLTNLCVQTADGERHFTPWALFALVALSAAGSLISIFLYGKRALQMRLVSLVMILLLGWHGLLAFLIFVGSEGATFRPALAMSFPVVSLVLLWLAFRAIWADEQLVRSLDRLR